MKNTLFKIISITVILGLSAALITVWREKREADEVADARAEKDALAALERRLDREADIAEGLRLRDRYRAFETGVVGRSFPESLKQNGENIHAFMLGRKVLELLCVPAAKLLVAYEQLFLGLPSSEPAAAYGQLQKKHPRFAWMQARATRIAEDWVFIDRALDRLHVAIRCDRLASPR